MPKDGENTERTTEESTEQSTETKPKETDPGNRFDKAAEQSLSKAAGPSDEEGEPRQPSFDQLLKENKAYKAEFDKRMSRAITDHRKTLEERGELRSGDSKPNSEDQNNGQYLTLRS